MFDRFIRLAKARKALREQRFEDALQFALDPVVAGDRRAEELRDQARRQLLVRAQRRLDQDDADGAAGILRRLQTLSPHPDQSELVAAVESRRRDLQVGLDRRQQHVEEIRALLGRGCTAAAASQLRERKAEIAAADVEKLEHELADLQRRAREALAIASSNLRQGDLSAAEASWRRAAALDGDAAGLGALRAELLPRLSQDVRERIEAALADGDLVGALALWRSHVGTAKLFSPADQAQQALPLQRALRRELTSCDLPAARALATAAAGFAADADVSALLGALQLAESLGTSSEAAPAWNEVAAAARAIGAAAVAEGASLRVQSVGAAIERMAAAQGAVAAGDLEAAEQTLRQLLVEQPLHEAARRELGLVEQGLSARQERLAAARAAARDGRLTEAASFAAALAGPTRVGEDARQLLAEVRARMAVVDRGVDEIRVALHGRAASGIEGVRHCLRRLAALREVQGDHQELQRLQAAVEAEIAGLELWEQARVAADAGDAPALARSIEAWLPLRAALLAEDRLDARFAEVTDRLHSLAEASVARGELAAAERTADLLEQLADIDDMFRRWAGTLRANVVAARSMAVELTQQARASLDERDLGEAMRLCEAAAGCDSDATEVRALRAELAELNRHEVALSRAGALARERDYGGAQQKLAELPPTPALLRTRIYDMKQSLAKAQGLEGSFLLRVDEGGECLVLRGESVSIGNVRQTRADLPVLANLAGRHATIRRSLSFHGGMQDVVVAEEGEVRVGNEPVTTRPLVSGDRVQLGSALTFVYSLPSARSLSAMVQLQGAFQVAGTDRVLLMKDRGKDGRLLLGPGRDCHVRVGSATAEVELFATNTGQMRVACAAGGKIDGAPFRGEHPVDAGQIVEAGGVSFVLLPWRAGT